MKSKFYPVDFAVPDYAAAKLYDAAIAQNKAATPEGLNHALTELFIRQPDVLAGYFLPATHHVHTS